MKPSLFKLQLLNALGKSGNKTRRDLHNQLNPGAEVVSMSCLPVKVSIQYGRVLNELCHYGLASTRRGAVNKCIKYYTITPDGILYLEEQKKGFL